MKTTTFCKAATMAALLTLALIGGSGAARANDPVQSGRASDRNGDLLLTVFNDLYFRWLFGNITLPTDQNGNAVVGGVALMPLPNVPGDGTPGSVQVTLKAGQQFFLPLLGLPGTSYSDGTPPDPFVDVKVLKRNLKIKVKLDGATIVDDGNAFDFYSQFYFDPPIPFNSPPLDSIIYLQAFGILQKPLSPGNHVITVDEKVTPIPIFGGVVFHNTFNITVQPR